jgi:2-polyprenyl-3-methyl-5-hydroxy-6-metoxy-1,4-benzoquinol methylase
VSEASSQTEIRSSASADQYCICCGSASVRTVYTVRSFPISRCADCGLGRTLLDQDFDFEKYYSEAYFTGDVNDGYADYTGSEEVLRLEFRRTLKHFARFAAKGNLLEFGCAYGFFLVEAAPLFERVEGIELCAEAVDFCQSRGLNVVRGVVDPETLRGPYDAAVGLDVIEHIPEPQQAIRLIAEKLNPGGTLLLTTGDWGSLLARAMGPKWRLMTPPQHLSFFTPKSMTRMLEAAGLRVVELSHPGKRVPMSLFAYQLLRLAGMKPRSFHGLNRWSLPINLWDAMRVIAVKP